MSMRMNYMMIPTDYIQSLKEKKGIIGRKKARSFMEYWNDMEQGEHNSYGFFSKGLVIITQPLFCSAAHENFFYKQSRNFFYFSQVILCIFTIL